MYITGTKANETTSAFGLVSVYPFCNGSMRLFGRFDRLSMEDCRHRGARGGLLTSPWCESHAKNPNPSADITKKTM